MSCFSCPIPHRFQGITGERERVHVLDHEMEAVSFLIMYGTPILRGG